MTWIRSRLHGEGDNQGTQEMHFGLFAINMGPCVEPEAAVRVARAAEAAGFESVWTGEHVVLPDPQVPPSPLPPEYPLLDPAVALAFLAAQTRTVRLGTGIIILPQRNPLVLAKELASLDAVSGGRLLFGVGIGYLKPEFDALGVPFDDKIRPPSASLACVTLRHAMAGPPSSAGSRSARRRASGSVPRPCSAMRSLASTASSRIAGRRPKTTSTASSI
jgi:alkanesulfonate monooxygenase SsuD/methylene tetrahydromethanopterin reductase-like flavin-dependent oxidoreductase (luciferase family)